jgi:ArpU family phage transcriptional regulator
MRRVTRFYSRVDDDTTAELAHAELCKYDENYALSRRGAGALQSPQFDGMPKSPSIDNHLEANVVNHVYAGNWVQRVNNTINGLVDDRYRIILNLYYLKHVDDGSIMARIGLEKSRYYEAKKDALVTFAEAWLPYPSELVVKR